MGYKAAVYMPQGVHFVGSTTFDTRQQHFRTIGSRLGHHLQSISDGEIEPPLRLTWVLCQVYGFEHAPWLLMRHMQAQMPNGIGTQVEVKDRSPLDVATALTDLQVGYDKWAIASYAEFRQLKKEGILPAHLKFQVAMPTPASATMFLIRPEYRAAAEPLYEVALLRALQNIQKQIPHDDLVIQFDIVAEIFQLENGWRKMNAYGLDDKAAPWFAGDTDADIRSSVLSNLSRWLSGGHVADNVTMGLHLCYGDASHRHFLEPVNIGQVADVIEYLIEGVDRPINYVHFPVPRAREDEAYLEPLQAPWSRIKERKTYLYVGLVHAADPQGTARRIEAAKKVLGEKGWGVASECGLGRTPEIESVLETYETVAKEWY